MKLLIIEDDESFANVISRRLAKHGIETVHATNSSDALLLARQHMPAYVLIDMNLGHESGLALITPLRHLLKDCKLVVLTGFASIATAVDAIKLGADEYLTKPIDSSTFMAALTDQKPVAKDNIPTDEHTMSTEQLEWEHIQQVLKFNQGNVSATARQLSMHRRTLQRKLQKKPNFNS